MDSDADLLRQFCAGRNEEAFTRLVERHAGMVRAVIWRRTGDGMLVEEATWKVFAILARKAEGLQSCTHLSGWLHRAARHEAGNAARKAERYRRTLQQYTQETMSPPPPPGSQSTWEEIQPHLDAALARLPAEAREMVLMHCLEQRGIPEIASVTGSNPETCRKRIRRSLDLLENLLRRRGLTVSGAAMATLLSANSPGISHGAAAAVAAHALQAAPSLTSTSLLLHSLHIMNSTTLVKTSLVVLILAASVPVTLLWRENHNLRESVKKLQAGAASPAESSIPAPMGKPSPADADVRSLAVPGPGNPSAEAPPATMNDYLQGLSAKAHAKAKKQAGQEFTRICLNLPDLSGDQQSQIRSLLETKYQTAIDEVLQLFQSGVVARAAQSAGDLTEAEKSAVAKLDPRGMDNPPVDKELKTILTDDQFLAYTVKKEQKRLGDAEDFATDRLKSLGKKFDLSPDQKDAIFQQLAHHELNPDKNAGAQVGPDNPFPQIGSLDEARDGIILRHLTPQQAEIYHHSRALEKEALQQQMMEFYSTAAAAMRK